MRGMEKCARARSFINATKVQNKVNRPTKTHDNDNNDTKDDDDDGGNDKQWQKHILLLADNQKNKIFSYRRFKSLP